MNVENYRSWFIVGSLALMLVAAAPTFALFIRLPSGSEKFSELWLLGLGHKAKDYPFNVSVNETYSVYVGVGNHLGYSAYCKVYVKFRNGTQPLPNVATSEPSVLKPFYEFRPLIANDGTWESRVTFSVLEVSSSDDSVVVGRLSINDLVSDVHASAKWDSEHRAFYYQLFFELWLYDQASRSFMFNNRFVGIWLNVTT